MRLPLPLVVIFAGTALALPVRADTPKTGLFIFDGTNVQPAGVQTFHKAMEETLQGDGRVRYVALAAAKPDPKAIDAELTQADRDMVIVEQAFSEMNLGKARTVTDQAIAVYEKCGFVREGVRRMQYRSGDAFRDEVLMAWFPEPPTVEADR